MDPDPGGPKSCGSGSATLLPCLVIVLFLRDLKFRSNVALRVCDRLNVYVTGLYEIDRVYICCM